MGKKIKTATIYWDEEMGEAIIKENIEMTGVMRLDYYSDILTYFNEKYDIPKAFKEMNEILNQKKERDNGVSTYKDD